MRTQSLFHFNPGAGRRLASLPWLLILSLIFSVLSPVARADSLWREGQARSLVGDKKAAQVGDLLNIIVQENNSATKDSTTKTSKKSSIDANISTFLYSPAASGFLTHNGQLPAMKIDAATGFDGGGQINNSERIVARITVRVVDTLPNKNMVVEGRRQTSFSGETQDVILRGIVRSEDISPNNTVYSYNVAESSIRFVSHGTITDSQRKGWFMRIWDKLTPF
jgi:flagellar L-ring protein FlgH